MNFTVQRPTRRTLAQKNYKRVSIDDKLLAAMERLIKKGHKFGALSVEQLTAEAGIARATFYLHFRDKGELVARLMGRMTSEIVESGGVWFQDAQNASPRDVHRALQGIVATFKKHQAIVAAIAETAAHDATVASLHGKMMQELCDASWRAISTVKKNGRASSGATRELADVLTWSVERFCAHFISSRNGREIDRLVDTFAHVCSSAIFASGT